MQAQMNDLSKQQKRVLPHSIYSNEPINRSTSGSNNLGYNYQKHIRPKNESNNGHSNSNTFQAAIKQQPTDQRKALYHNAVQKNHALLSQNYNPNSNQHQTNNNNSYQQPFSYNNNNPSNGWATISFSLLNTKQFTAKADNGFLCPQVFETLKLFNVQLDEKKKRLIFSISDHYRLQTALGASKVMVEPLPQSTISAAQMQNQREEELIRSSELNNTNNNGSLLEGRLPVCLMDALAPFQKAGVEFALKNDGRVLIADEMGLGMFMLIHVFVDLFHSLIF